MIKFLTFLGVVILGMLLYALKSSLITHTVFNDFSWYPSIIALSCLGGAVSLLLMFFGSKDET